MDIIKYVKNITSKKEFNNQFIDLIFIETKNKGETKTFSYIQIPNSVTSIKYGAFYNCNRLKSITIPDSITIIGEDAFRNCNSLTSITIPNSVISIGLWGFANCSSLTSITIPSSVKSIGYYSFYKCNSLTCISIPKKFEKYMNEIFKYVDLSKVKITYI